MHFLPYKCSLFWGWFYSWTFNCHTISWLVVCVTLQFYLLFLSNTNKTNMYCLPFTFLYSNYSEIVINFYYPLSVYKSPIKFYNWPSQTPLPPLLLYPELSEKRGSLYCRIFHLHSFHVNVCHECTSVCRTISSLLTNALALNVIDVSGHGSAVYKNIQ